MYRPIVEMDTCKACHRLLMKMCSAACHVTAQPKSSPVDKPHKKIATPRQSSSPLLRRQHRI